VTWYFSNIARLRVEREGIETFALGAEWLTLLGWRMDESMQLVLDAEITVGDHTFSVFLRYPEMFPFSPPSVFPKDQDARWSSHQFGPGGELCLEHGPDNWTPDNTGVEVIGSAHHLLSLENPTDGVTRMIASRHQETLGQTLRLKYMRLLITRELAAFFESVPVAIAVSGNLVMCYHPKGSTYILNTATVPGEVAWTDAGIPKPLVDEGRDRPVTIYKIDSKTPLPSTTDLPAFRAGCVSLGFETNDTLIILLRGSEVHFYFLWEADNSVSVGSILPPQTFHARLDGSHATLTQKSVALVGCGSLGSKVGMMLARSGVTRFFLVDDDLLLPDNFVRNDLDWRDVGSHKTNALARRMTLANPATESEVWRARLGGQESGSSAETMLKLIGDCDLIFDATANPDILNLMSAVAGIRKKPLIWAEIFGGGIGGLIARCRADIEPSPQYMRRAIENWFGDKGSQPVRYRRSYETGLDGPPLIADDADVSAIAAHAARLAIDVLIGREPSLFPHSVYAIGLGVGSVFEQPFQTFPIEVGSPPPGESAPEPSPQVVGEELARLMKLFEARANEVAAASKDN
jgi:hypothetical protein